MRILYSLLLLPLVASAQVASGPLPAPRWSAGAGVGNAVGVYLAYERGPLLLLGRARYWWRGAASGPGSRWFDKVNTRSRQTEVGLLAGRSLPLGRGQLYGAAGLAWVGGRKLGEYRYSVQYSGVLGSEEYVFAYRQYQALGLPLEVGVQTPLRPDGARWGLALQANLNPQQSLFCALLTLTLGNPSATTTP
ncbi:hypothetical protein GCM10027422_30120 [Hymenobacter arcticus]